jgi:hypothetical protein
MDDEQIKNSIATLTEHVLVLESNLADLRAAVKVLKVYVVTQLTPDDPKEGLEQLESLEKMLLEHDPKAPARKEAADAIEAVKLWEKLGGGHYES